MQRAQRRLSCLGTVRFELLELEADELVENRFEVQGLEDPWPSVT